MRSPEMFTLSDQEWIQMIKTQELPEDFLFFYASHIPDRAWHHLTIFQKLTEKFILDFHYKFSIAILLTNQVIHENTIRENMIIFQDYLWDVCRYQYLSEEFMLDYQDQVDWKQLFLHQKHLSTSFIIRNFIRFPRDEFIYDPLDVFHMEIYYKNKDTVLKMVTAHNKKVRSVSGTIRTRS